MITANCHTDDYAVDVNFDATQWFAQASDKEILSLAKCEWGGDYPADSVAHYMASHNEELAGLFKYLEIVAYKKDAPGFECHVSETDAKRWIEANRLELFSEIENLI